MSCKASWKPVIAENAGTSDPVAVAKVKEMTGDDGFNAATGVYEDLVKGGVIDPAKVARLALQNAASIGSLLLTTETMVSEQTEETSPEQPPAHTGFGHGGHA